MKKAILKASLPISALLLASGLQVAQAHCVGPLSAVFSTATIAAGSTTTNQFDQYLVTCPATSLSLRARVAKRATGTANTPVTLTVADSGNAVQLAAASVSDTTASTASQCNGAANESIGSGASAFTFVNGGDGLTNNVYVVTVSKNSANSTYAAELHCHQGLGGTGVEDVPVPTAAGLDFDRVVDN